MKTNILSSFDLIPYFSIEAVKQLWEENAPAAGSIQTALYRWEKEGKIFRLKKGLYMTRRFYEQHRGDAEFSAMVSAILIPLSYLSLEYVLQQHGILTEITYPVTAVTLKQTRVIKNKLGTFSYRNLKEELYKGFEVSVYQGVPVARASAAKALFDFLYLRPWKNKDRLPGYNLAEDLRLNLEGFSEESRQEFETFVKESSSPKMERILKNLKENIWQN